MEQLVLPADMVPDNTCFFTGHRFLPDGGQPVYPSLVQCILDRAEEGCRYFLSGGALGFDLLTARTVLLLREKFGLDVRLVLALPCRNQTERWLSRDGRETDSLRVYHAVKSGAGRVLYLSDLYYDGCMKVRNRFMVEHSTRCIAYWNGSARGGTAQTVRMAKDAAMPVYNLYTKSPEAAGTEL